MRASFKHAALNLAAHRLTDRISRHAAALLPPSSRRLDCVRRPYVARPLPDVADHIAQPVAVGLERIDRRCPHKPIECQILPRKLTLPGIRPKTPLGGKFLPPCIPRSLQPAARRVLPLRLARQRLAGPPGIGARIRIRHMNHRMRRTPLHTALRPLRAPPTRPRHIGPPRAPVPQAHRALRRTEYQRPWDQLLRVDPRIVPPIRPALRHRYVAGRLDEARKISISHRAFVDPEPVNLPPMRR